jgi:hypothetical protein
MEDGFYWVKFKGHKWEPVNIECGLIFCTGDELPQKIELAGSLIEKWGPRILNPDDKNLAVSGKVKFDHYGLGHAFGCDWRCFLSSEFGTELGAC